MKRPLIGIMPLYDSEKDSYWMLPGYMHGIEAAGGAPVMLPLTDDARLLRQLGETLDGLLFTGGQDISPRLYGEKAILCGEICPARDRMELIMLDAAAVYGHRSGRAYRSCVYAGKKISPGSSMASGVLI